MNNLCIVPARHNTTGLPNKNLLKLGDKTLVQLAVERAKASGLFADIVISTDSVEIARIAEAVGCKAYQRPVSLTGTDSSLESVALHALSVSESTGNSFNTVAIVSPAAPLTSPDDLRAAYELFDSGAVQSVVSVTPTLPVIVQPIKDSRRGLWHIGNHAACASSRRKPIMVRNGAFTITDVGYLKEARRLVGEKSYVYSMPKERSLTVGDPYDYLCVKALYEEQKKVLGSAC